MAGSYSLPIINRLKKMCFRWEEFFELARDLSIKCTGSHKYTQEAVRRTAISRAYYAVYRSTRNYAEKNLNFRPKYSGKDHRNLIKHLIKLGKEWAEVGTNIDRLKVWRRDCDYEDVIADDLEAMHRDAIDIAENILNHLRKSFP